MEKDINIYNYEERCIIKAKKFFLDEKKTDKHFFVFCHGFCSGKGSESVRIVASKLLEYGISSISFDFPGHVDSVQGSEKLKIDVCISYINSVINYIRSEYSNDVKISFYAISFGAYILLNKLIGDNSEYYNIVLRSPAFNMKKIFETCLLKESLKEFVKNGKAKAGHGGKIEVLYSFYEDLINNNLYNNYKEKRKILVIQGKLDDTAMIQDTYEFIKNKPEIDLIEFENMKHHMSIEEIEYVTNKMIKKLNIV